MSFRVAVMVEDRIFASSTEKLVMFKLALSGNDDGQSVRPSVWTIASATQLSERTVQRMLKDMPARGLPSIAQDEDPRRKRPRIYRIDKAQLEALPMTEAAEAREERRRERARNAAGGQNRPALAGGAYRGSPTQDLGGVAALARPVLRSSGAAAAEGGCAHRATHRAYPGDLTCSPESGS
ncbi:MAG: helix-turn-helix domain-containing protein [Rhodospirillales bacterium]|nr:helix-turn-helix domain-containing protein [Rhodospirillales bacterium]MDH3916896.1 helix-turn-helix domain-containing protein [Rhodospirillales bacterium]MDH3968057.1 helix-turn-helix domain-containing protein [Rhodospirillales bacterium]